MTGQTLASALEQAWARWPDRRAVVDDDRVLTYRQLEEHARTLAGAYRTLGIGRGDCVVCHLPNSGQLIIAAAAAWLHGAIHVPADPGLTQREVMALLDRTHAAAVVYRADHGSDGDSSTFVRLAGRLADRATTTARRFDDLVSAEVTGDDDGSRHDALPGSAAAAAVQPDDAALILPTSGTTGVPKLPIGYHGPLQAGWGWLAGQLRLGPQDVHLGHLPMSHGFGLSTAVMALITGGCIVMVRDFSAEGALDAVSRHGVTVLHGTPTHFILVTDRHDPARHDLRTLRVGIGTAARFPPLLLRRIFDELGMDLLFMYGSSEGVSVVTTDRDEMLAGSVGRPERGWVAIMGNDGCPLIPGEVGEIAFRRDMWPVAYWGEDHGVDRELWYRTGDIGRMDDEGRLFVIGRLKHQIDRGGLKVDPGEVEDLLVHCPGVLDVACVGAPNPVLGEVVCACVVTKPGTAVTLDELRAQLAQQLAQFKLPEELLVLPQLPRTPSGKVDRAALSGVAAAAPRESVRAR